MILDKAEDVNEILWPKLRICLELGNGKNHFITELENANCSSEGCKYLVFHV